MLLQIDKVLESKKEVVRTDIIEGVKRTNYCEDFLMVELNDGDIKTFAKGEIDNSFNPDVSEEFKSSYIINRVWLLNDEGKTLRKLI